MGKRHANAGFTLLEVTFATGILLLSFGLVLGAMFSLTRVREINQARLQVLVAMNNQLELVRGLELQPAVELLSAAHASPAPGMSLDFIVVGFRGEPVETTSAAPRFIQITAGTTTSRGYPVSVRAICAVGGAGAH